MHSSLLFLFTILFHELATATQTANGHPILEPISDDGWSNSVGRRSAKDSLKLLDSEHLVWNSAAGKQQSRYLSAWS